MTETDNRLEKLGSAAVGIAHDINNHLACILNHLEMTDIDSARAAVTRCSSLTSNLLTYCRYGAPETELIDLAAFLPHFLATFKPPKGVSIEMAHESRRQYRLPRVRSNFASLKRILANLANNACEAMNNKGAIAIAIGDGVMEVADNGPGIPPDAIGRVFEPFFTTKGDCGTGLGLAIVRELMRQHGGTVSVESEAGRGTIFTLRFRTQPRFPEMNLRG
ncbi:MAG: HAMP domain-containing histidine kinase [Acidobacteriota bacterium]|nr:HAMP domain-containing histidine kinase [Acidobacteriota bacterium]